jgi:hypothetical protein
MDTSKTMCTVIFVFSCKRREEKRNEKRREEMRGERRRNEKRRERGLSFRVPPLFFDLVVSPPFIVNHPLSSTPPPLPLTIFISIF